VPRWKHHATLNWEYGPWGTTLAQTYQSSYADFNADRQGHPLTVPPRSVGSYEVWDLQGRYGGLRNTTIALGVKNLMDRAPPFSNQPVTRQVGYDPKYADPRGRTYYVRLTYAFK
jgi:iron complex outermembrane receptor protein